MKAPSSGLLELFIGYGYYPNQVMRSLVAVIALIGQLQWLPGSLVCMRQQATSDPCAATMPDGSSIAAPAAPAHGAASCSVTGPCAVVAPAVLPSTVAAFVPEVVYAGAQGAPARFVGIVSPPLAPPPQA